MLRLPLYAEAAELLLAADKAYPCYCTPEELDADRKAQEAAKQPPRYVGRCTNLTAEERAAREAEGRRAALRFRVGEGIVGFDDLVRGHVEFDVANLGGDFVIVRGDGTPLYHFTVVVDDAAMQISHVIRGEDHLSNTPKHILLFRALGYPEPLFAHLPLILNPDRTKMSKRKSQMVPRPPDREGSLLLSKRSHRYPRMIVNQAGAYTTDTIYRGKAGAWRRVSARALSAGFHNSLTLLSAELEGRSFGGGVLELVRPRSNGWPCRGSRRAWIGSSAWTRSHGPETRRPWWARPTRR